MASFTAWYALELSRIFRKSRKSRLLGQALFLRPLSPRAPAGC